MTKMLETTFALLIGTIVTINGMNVKVDSILNDAKTAVNGANIHQLATVIELYYSDNNHYPEVSGGEALIDTLEKDGYIRNRPLDPNVFTYELRNGGQDYTLALAK